MSFRRHPALPLAAFFCGLLSLLLFLPAEPWPWVGLAGALAAVVLGRLAQPQTRLLQVLALSGILLAAAAGISYILLFWGKA